MCEEKYRKLWVVKFCLKVVFPRFNLYLFLVYLAVKFKVAHRRKQALLYATQERVTEMYKICPVPEQFLRRLITLSLDKHVDINSYLNCVIIQHESYLKMATENPFYYDHKTLWVALHLAPHIKGKLKAKNDLEDTKSQRYNLKQMKSRIHRQLWCSSDNEKYNNIRIVRVIGSDNIPNDTVVVTEDEAFNLKNSFGLEAHDDTIELEIKPVPSMDCVPQIATSAVVQMVVYPFDPSTEFVTELLSNYFSSPRIVRIDDIFSIELTKEMTTKYHYKYFDLVESTPRVYFKCWKINGNTKDAFKEIDSKAVVQSAYFIVKGKTELNLGEHIHSMTPTLKHLALSNNNLVTDSCPFGLKKIFDKMRDSIVPFLINRQGNPLHTSLAAPIMPIFFLSGAVGSGRHLLVKTLARHNGVNCLVMDCNVIQSTTAKQTESKISSLVQRAKACSPVIVLMDNFEVFAVDAENNEDCRVLEYFRNATSNLFENYTTHPIIFVAISERTDLKPNILRLFLDRFHVDKPTSSERYEMLEWFTRVMGLKFGDVKISEIDFANANESHLDKNAKDILQKLAAKTETFLKGDLDTLVHFALRNSFVKHHDGTLENNSYDSILGNLTEEDFSFALESMRALQSQHMDAPKIPKVYWEDIGGLHSLKKELLKTIEFPIKYPHLFKNSSLKRSGILLYGPPGCGKTLVAKALSTELNVSFLSVKGPELLNMYIGQSEENVRKVFESARAASPCIVFLDELDALAPRRGATGDSGGASDRVVSQLLAEIDGVADAGGDSTSSFVFIMGATNRPDLLEKSLLRPGRLDKLIYVGPYCGLEEKTRVLTALCRKRCLSSRVSLQDTARSLPPRCTGADLMRVASVARAAAVRRTVAALHAGLARESDLDGSSIVLEPEDFQAGVAAFAPSVTEQEFAHYERLQGQL